MTFPAYPEYKDSGVEWLGVVPMHWNVQKLKHIATIRNGRDHKEVEVDEGGYPVFGSGGEFTRASTYLHEGESVLLGRKGTVDKPLYVTGRFWTVDTMFYTEVSRTADARYIYYYSTQFPFAQHSTNTALPSMAQEDLANLVIATPDLAEQRQVSRFLDYETARTDALIEEQKRLIELLKEKRQALVLSARGKQGTVTTRLEHVAAQMARPVEQKEEEDYVPIGLYNRGRGLFHKEPRRKEDMGGSQFYWVRQGDLIISGQFAWEGAIAMAGPEEEGCVVSHRYPIIRGVEGIARTEYIFALLSTRHGDFLLNENSRGAAGRNRPLNIASLLKEKIWVPPMKDQETIGSIVREEEAIKDMVRLQQSILQERRSSLVFSAVTGKIDVCDWQEPKAAGAGAGSEPERAGA
ncbi:MAG: restriction endonuclease [Spiribacter salinus]|uniref:Restriction endonuclease n=1 Tax=Spiribacter salinus TaxID=1335746 RepID=A0A540VRW7_9GAMM|nr:MAG: restriction endonuclease [Spiribacter salinus]